MELNWFKSLLYGLISGLADILPISAEAHQILLMKLFGSEGRRDLMDLFIHLAISAALYMSSRKQIVRMARARSLAKVPKRRRRRPLDTNSLMDLSLLKTMLVPVILSFFLFQYTAALQQKMIWIAVLLFVNGLILYIPQFLPTGNRDSRTLSRVEGLLMGLGGALGILPGISPMGCMLSVGSVCGVERGYCLNLAMLMNMAINLGLVVLDVMGLIQYGVDSFSFLILVQYIVTAAAAFGSTMLGVKIMRMLSKNNGYSIFTFYSWSVALFTFILNLMA